MNLQLGNKYFFQIAGLKIRYKEAKKPINTMGVKAPKESPVNITETIVRMII